MLILLVGFAFGGDTDDDSAAEQEPIEQRRGEIYALLLARVKAGLPEAAAEIAHERHETVCRAAVTCPECKGADVRFQACWEMAADHKVKNMQDAAVLAHLRDMFPSEMAQRPDAEWAKCLVAARLRIEQRKPLPILSDQSRPLP
jgi:hypothetical protein